MAALVLISWPIVALTLFAALGPARGLIWATVIGYLFVPTDYGFAISGLPDYDKRVAITLGLLLGIAVFGRTEPGTGSTRQETEDKLFRALILIFLAVLLLGPLATIRDNGGALVDADRVRRGLGFRDLISMTSASVLSLVPFFLGRRWLSSPEHHRQLLIALAIAGLAYSLLVVFEVRMSPQLNRWVYGYFPHSWRQHVRGDGFRPVVFLEHGLSLGFFLFMSVISAVALGRQDTSGKRGLLLLMGGWLFVVLLMSRNLGASAIALMILPLLFLAPSVQTRVIGLVAVIFLSYPILRQADLVPTSTVVSQVESFAPNRARSLQWRLDNEDDLLARSVEKRLFGWGGWGRWRVIDEKGRDTTTADGLWIITLGERGWAGYVGRFGFLTLPLLFLNRARRRKMVPAVTLGAAAIVAGNLIYLVPNSTLPPITFLMVGALAGFVQYRSAGSPEADTAPDTPSARRPVSAAPREGPRYTRFGAETSADGPVPLRR